VREVVEEFLEEMNVRIRDVQPAYLGQALVHFENIFDIDLLVNNCPHPYGGVSYTVVRHNAAKNWRAIQFNQECWLMLLGFPLDCWNNDSIQNALVSFGRMIMWENDRDHLARLMVRAWVTNLQEVPYFLVLTEAEGFQGESWTVQVEIVEQEMLGAYLQMKSLCKFYRKIVTQSCLTSLDWVSRGWLHNNSRTTQFGV
jgi:hypothetical protein